MQASVLPTKEFTQEGIGFVMIQGEYVYITFYSSTPAFFLLHRPLQISIPTAILIGLLYGTWVDYTSSTSSLDIMIL